SFRYLVEYIELPFLPGGDDQLRSGDLYGNVGFPACILCRRLVDHSQNHECECNKCLRDFGTQVRPKSQDVSGGFFSLSSLALDGKYYVRHDRCRVVIGCADREEFCSIYWHISYFGDDHIYEHGRHEGGCSNRCYPIAYISVRCFPVYYRGCD